MTRFASDQLQRKQDGDKKEDDDLCAICLSGFDDQNPKFHLDCKHAFHGKCIIQSLRYKTWCPTCKDDPKRKDREEDDEEEEEDDSNDSDVEHTKRRMLKKLKTETIKSILGDCNEPTHGDRSTLAGEAAMMLTLTSDEEGDGENESDEEDEENDDAAEMVDMIQGFVNRRV